MSSIPVSRRCLFAMICGSKTVKLEIDPEQGFQQAAGARQVLSWAQEAIMLAV